jgi:putative FmdB family regulatory protein
MPVYDYKCAKCGKFEKTQRITEPALTICPTCGSQVERIISRNVGIVFKGSGFYCTDNTRGKERARSINKERQKDNQALMDGDVKSYVNQAEKTTEKVNEA